MITQDKFNRPTPNPELKAKLSFYQKCTEMGVELLKTVKEEIAAMQRLDETGVLRSHGREVAATNSEAAWNALIDQIVTDAPLTAEFMTTRRWRMLGHPGAEPKVLSCDRINVIMCSRLSDWGSWGHDVVGWIESPVHWALAAFKMLVNDHDSRLELDQMRFDTREDFVISARFSEGVRLFNRYSDEHSKHFWTSMRIRSMETSIGPIPVGRTSVDFNEWTDAPRQLTTSIAVTPPLAYDEEGLARIVNNWSEPERAEAPASVEFKSQDNWDMW